MAYAGMLAPLVRRTKAGMGIRGRKGMAVTKVGRHFPTPSMEAAEQRAFARSERRRGVREGTGGAGRRAAAWRGRPASPLTLPARGLVSMGP